LVPVIAFSDPESDPGPGSLAAGISLAGLALLVWGIAAEAHPGLGGRHLAALLLLIAAVSGWVGWIATRSRAKPVSAIFLAVMGLAGGALAPFAALALVFVGVTALGAAAAWPLGPALLLVATGPLATLISVVASDHHAGIILGSLAAALAGMVTGLSRRQTRDRAAQAALMQVTEARADAEQSRADAEQSRADAEQSRADAEQSRADAEQARAELMAGRNHLARELHDVLAHTLSALSLQLEALDAVVSAHEGDPAMRDVQEQVDRTKRLLHNGLAEARGAVRALREDALPLEEQLARLALDRNASIEISGSPRALPPEVSLALYRVAQEALTNVAKHAPGADARIDLGFEDNRVRLAVANGRSGFVNGSPLAATGSAYGLQGIRERVLLIGGQVEAGPSEAGGWRVCADVPA
jgi:signal transduction histidine kinase